MCVYLAIPDKVLLFHVPLKSSGFKKGNTDVYLILKVFLQEQSAVTVQKLPCIMFHWKSPGLNQQE